MAFTSKLVPGMCYLVYLRMFQFLHNPFHSCCLLLLGQSGRKIKFSSLLYTLGKHDRVFRNFYCVGTNHMRDQSKKTTAFTVNKQPWVTSKWQFELQFSSFIDVVKVTLTHQNSAVSPTAVQSNLTWVKKFKKKKGIVILLSSIPKIWMLILPLTHFLL